MHSIDNVNTLKALPEWYTPAPTPHFDKLILSFVEMKGTSSGGDQPPAVIFIDASYPGELLALSDAPFLQGADEAFDGDVSGTAGDGSLGAWHTLRWHSKE